MKSKAKNGIIAKAQINKLCKRIEKQYNIKILFAVENGSRAWGFESEDSDYDVRFVYKREIKEYLRINKNPDVITCGFDRQALPAEIEGCFYDFSGFDIFKFAKLLSSSNPTVLEWVTAYAVYYGRRNTVFENYAVKHFDPMALYYHYTSLCKNQYLTYIKNGKCITYKKYLYAMRGIINALYVKQKAKLPLLNFADALASVDIESDIRAGILHLIEIKKKTRENDVESFLPLLDNVIESHLSNTSIVIPSEKKDPELAVLDKEIHRLLFR